MLQYTGALGDGCFSFSGTFVATSEGIITEISNPIPLHFPVN